MTLSANTLDIQMWKIGDPGRSSGLEYYTLDQEVCGSNSALAIIISFFSSQNVTAKIKPGVIHLRRGHLSNKKVEFFR